MARANVPFLSFNRGLVSPKALGRVDLDRTKLSAEVYTNWLPKTQGAMTLRPGTKWCGSSFNDTGAEFIEFVSSTDDVALVELTHQKMRVWLGEDAHSLALLSRPFVSTTVSITDTGWSDASTGGTASISTIDAIPQMTGATTSGVTITASSENASVDDGDGGGNVFHIADNNLSTEWHDTGDGNNSLPSWVKVDFGSPKSIARYSIRASSRSGRTDSAPDTWQLQGNDVDTGNGWTTEDTQGSETGWATSEKRTYTLEDTGTPGPWRYWRLNVTGVDTDLELIIAEIEMFEANVNTKVTQDSNGITLNASAIGSLARARKRVVVDTGDRGVEHSLAIAVARGPVVFRVGSTSGDDDYVSETSLGTGYHNLAFTPNSDFHITMQTDALVNRVVSSLSIGDSGTVEITAPWEAADIDNIRYDQSADVVYVDCQGVRPSKIERRGTGRSWSVVDYAPNNGPFLATASSAAKMKLSHFFGNTDLTSDVPFFSPGHVGALFRAFHEGQGGQWRLGALEAVTDAIAMTGIQDTDTGSHTAANERRIVFSVTGTWSGTIIIERSFDGPDLGFKPSNPNYGGSTTGDTGTFSRTIDDEDDNLKVWYRARVSSYTSGVAVVTATYAGGGVTGICRVTGYNSNTNVDVEVLSRFSDTGPTANWQEGYWSDARSFPTAVALHGGRLFHAVGGNLFGSVADDYENFNQETVGDAGPIIRTLGSGPVDSIHYLVSLLRLIIGTAGAELALTSSSLDEPVTPSNSNARGFSTQGGANLRAVKLDTRAIMAQRSRSRVLMLGPGTQGSAFGDYEGLELTLLVPDLLSAGIVSIAIQRQPDTRIHCVLANGRVGILTYEPQEEVLCWTMWQTDTGTGGAVERAMVLPGVGEDAVYYHIRRTINGATKRYLEKWAMESECTGDTGLTWLMDCASSFNSNLIPAMTGPTTAGVTITASKESTATGEEGWRVGDKSGATEWWVGLDGSGASDSGWVVVDFGAGNAKRVGSFAVTAGPDAQDPDGAPSTFFLQGNDVDTGTGWTTEISVSGASGWSAGERRLYADTGFSDTGANAWRYWRFLVTAVQTANNGLEVGELELYPGTTNKTAVLKDVAPHLIGESVVGWGDLDSGSYPYVDLSPDVEGVQTRYTVDTGGDVTLSTSVQQAVVGLPYVADWKSTKLAYAAEAGTALAQMKRTDKIGFVLYQTHCNGLFYGSDSGHLDPLPRNIDAGGVVDPDKIFEMFDKVAMAFPGLWDTNSRIHLRAKSPRPCTVLAAVPTVQTNERV